MNPQAQSIGIDNHPGGICTHRKQAVTPSIK